MLQVTTELVLPIKLSCVKYSVTRTLRHSFNLEHLSLSSYYALNCIQYFCLELLDLPRCQSYGCHLQTPDFK